MDAVVQSSMAVPLHCTARFCVVVVTRAKLISHFYQIDGVISLIRNVDDDHRSQGLRNNFHRLFVVFTCFYTVLVKENSSKLTVQACTIDVEEGEVIVHSYPLQLTRRDEYGSKYASSTSLVWMLERTHVSSENG